MMAAAVATVGCQSAPSGDGLDLTAPTPAPEYATADDPFEPIPTHVDVDPDAVALGAALYADPILSGDRSVSCVDCHDLEHHGGGDGRAFAKLPTRERGLTNVTTVFNVGFNFKFGWIGKFDSMEEHLDAPMGGSLVMDISWDEVVTRLKADAGYQRQFEAAYRDGITDVNVRHALAEFQRSLITPNSRFDRFLRGDDHDGLTPKEQRGYALFKELGCSTCHQGIGVGGNMLQRFGVMVDYPVARDPRPADLGRYQYTRDEKDRMVFRVPSLRNVAVTAPYFHDGSAETLEEAVETMALHQLGRELDDEQIDLLVAFLHALTGEYEGELLTAVARVD